MFFFKQKTAYEMRISDWSSDVCSSDLQVGGGHQDECSHGEHAEPKLRGCLPTGERCKRCAEDRPHRAQRPFGAGVAGLAGRPQPVAHPGLPLAGIPRTGAPPPAETGRATCRARVCPSADLLTVPVHLTKKKNQP